MSTTNHLVSPPVKVDRKERVIVGTAKAHRWRITIPASVTGTQRKRLFFKTEMEAKAKVALYNENRAGLGVTQTELLSKRGMTVEEAVAYAIKHSPAVSDVTLPKNTLRHTAVTMRVNSTGNIPETAVWAGNSAAVIIKHYLGTGTPEDAQRFYALRPPTGKVISMALPPVASEAQPGVLQQATG